jgi:hypothetical protein
MEVDTFTILTSSPIKSPFSSGKKRIATPTAQRSSPLDRSKVSHKRALSSQLGSSPLKKRSQVQDGKDMVEYETQDRTHLPQFALHSRHVTLDFKLFDRESGYIMYAKDSQTKTLYALFPNVVEISIRPPIILFKFKQLPPKPWPLTVAGISCVFTDNDEYTGEVVGWPAVRAAGTIDLRPAVDFDDTTDGFDHLHKIMDWYNNQKLKIFEVRSFGAYLQVVVADETSKKSLPDRFNTVPVRYLWKSAVPARTPTAKRAIAPRGTTYDTTDYTRVFKDKSMCPGVMITSAKYPIAEHPGHSEWTTVTSGVQVQDAQGNKFVTVPTHMFARNPQDRSVWHPDPVNGVKIGTVSRVIPNTDISLMRLEPGFTYKNETFDNAETNQPLVITALATTASTRFDPVVMDTPQMGTSWGAVTVFGLQQDADGANRVQHEWYAFQSHPDDPEDDKFQREPHAGVCGALITNDSTVVGFYHLLGPAPTPNQRQYSLAISALELSSRGYTTVG